MGSQPRPRHRATPFFLRHPHRRILVLVVATATVTGALVATSPSLRGTFGFADRSATVVAADAKPTPAPTRVTPGPSMRSPSPAPSTPTDRPVVTPSRDSQPASRDEPRTTEETPTRAKKPVVRPTPTPTSRGKSTATSWERAQAAEVLRLINAIRVGEGCAALKNVTALTAAAQGHSADMAANGYFDHTSKDGRSPFDRMRAAGYPNGSAENIAAGQPNAAAVVGSWMASAGHRANILDCANRASGVGVARGGSYGVYWTHAFGRS
jgi:uncharacterized protein YkwD